MPGTVLITLEGVMAGPVAVGGAWASRQPIQDGLLLFHGLRGLYRTILSADETNEDLVRHWLKLQGITDERYSRLIVRENIDADRDTTELRKRHLDSLSALGWRCSFILTANTDLASWALAKGNPVLVMSHPEYIRPEFRPDHQRGPRPWDEIDAELTRQRELAKTDPRR